MTIAEITQLGKMMNRGDLDRHYSSTTASFHPPSSSHSLRVCHLHLEIGIADLLAIPHF